MMLRVKHDEALGHVGERCIEQEVLVEQFLFARLQIGGALRNGVVDHVIDLIELLSREWIQNVRPLRLVARLLASHAYAFSRPLSIERALAIPWSRRVLRKKPRHSGHPKRPLERCGSRPNKCPHFANKTCKPPLAISSHD